MWLGIPLIGISLIYLYFAISYCLIKIYPFDGLEAKTNEERLGHAAHI